MAEPDAESVRDTADDVLRQTKFDEPSDGPVERLLEWIGDRLDDLFSNLDGPSGGSGAGGFVVGWVLLILAAVFIVWVLWRIMPRSLRRAPRETIEVETSTRTRTGRDEWLRRASEAESEGRWREAVRSRYRATVAGLLDRQELPEHDGATSGEYRSAFDAPAPRGPSFDEVSDRFETTWYGGEAAESATAARMATLDRTLVPEDGAEHRGADHRRSEGSGSDEVAS